MWSKRGSSDQKLISMQPWRINVRIYDESYQYVVHFTLPSFRHWPISFIKDVLSGKKLVSASLIAIENQWLRDHEIVKLNIPNYPEFSVKSMYSKLKDIQDIASHMPDFKKDNILRKHIGIKYYASSTLRRCMILYQNPWRREELMKCPIKMKWSNLLPKLQMR